LSEPILPGLQRPKIDFIYFDAGGGHRSAATALDKVVAAEGYGWDVRLVNLQEVLDPLDVFRKLTNIRLEDLYNKMLAKGWTLGASYWLPVMQLVIRQYHKPSVELLARFWRERKPDMVVSLVPNLNRAMFEGLKQACPEVPYVGILTDLADYPPHFWMERQDQYIVCGTERARQQATELGLARDKIYRVSGMILRPDYYKRDDRSRDEERIRLGLAPDVPTALVLFGGEGSNVMHGLCRRLGNSPLNLQIIAICGKNAKLKARLQGLKTRNRLFVEGFTREIPHYMALSDFFIGKPGPGSISEALHMGLPVIIEANSWTLPQERFNAKWVRENGYGIVLKNLQQVESAVGELLGAGRLQDFKNRIETLHNRAVYEIPEILASILKTNPRLTDARCV
jgi:1,2-diacylglycerol 3-beta-galactosyltransferase